MLFDSVLTIPTSVFSLRNISGGRDVGQIRWNIPDSSLYMYSGSQWIKINTDTSQLSNRIANKLNITDTSSMLSWYLRKVDTASLSNRIDLRVKYTDTASMFNAYHNAIKARIKYTDSASMLAPYLRKLDTLSLSNRINKKQDTLTLTTSGTSGPSTLIGSALNIPNYGSNFSNYVPYVGAFNNVDLGVNNLTADFLFAKGSLKVQDNITATGGTDNYTSIQTKNTEFVFFTQKTVSSLAYKNVARFLYATPNVNFTNEYNYNLPVRSGTLALVEDTVSLSNRINAITSSDTTSLSNRINLKLNISDTASMLSPYLRKADTSSLSNRIDLRVKYSDTAAMLSPYLKSAVTSVGLSMPSAFTVTNSPVTSTGTLTVTGAGNTSQYIDGTGALQTMQGIVTEVETLVKEVYNETGATLTKGTVVYINGGHGNLPTITKAASTSDSLSAQTFGVVRADIGTNSNGYVIVVGDLNDMPTNSYPNGTQLYLSTTAGQFTSTKQYAPSHLVYVGVVTRSHPTQGVISVKIQNGYEMDELHNVSAQSPSNNSLLQYKTSTNLWTKVDGTTSNIAEGTNLYYTEARVDANTNVAANTAARHNALTIGTANGLTLFSQVLSLGTASTTNTGALTSADWNTFNGKGSVSSVATGLGLLGGTITTSGTLSVDTASASILSRQRAANTYYLASNPNGYNTGTVTSVATGLGLSGGTISTSGTLLVDTSSASILSRQRAAATYQAAGTYVTSVTGTSPIVSSGGTTPAISIPAATSSVNGYLSSTDWTTFNNKGSGTVTSVAALTLGTSGTDLSSTVANSTTTPVITLNVPTASATNRGALSSADWTTFNNKGNGTVTSVATGLGLSGGTITTSGTLLIDTASASILSRQRAANTYATTSSLSGYLPLTGGTLTGPLGGTTATFSGLLQVGTNPTGGNTPTSAVFNLSADSENGVIVRRGGLSDPQELKFGTNQAGLYSTIQSVQAGVGVKPLILNGGGGEVIVGTTSLASGFSTFAQIEASGSTGGILINSATNNIGRLIFSNNNASGGEGLIRYLGSNQSMEFWTNASQKMTITSDGNVGIGTQSPGTKLHITGTTEMRLNTTSSGSIIQFWKDSNASYASAIGNANPAGSVTNDLIFSTYVDGSSWTERMRIASGGSVTMSSLGTGTVTASSGTLSTVSDSSFKIADGFIEDALPSVMNLKPRYFYWKDKSGLDTTIRQLGFYAQEVNSAIGEEAANTPKKDSPWGITDRSLIAFLTKAIQELSVKNEALIKRIETLENK
jgi:hypothetical protein